MSISTDGPVPVSTSSYSSTSYPSSGEVYLSSSSSYPPYSSHSSSDPSVSSSSSSYSYISSSIVNNSSSSLSSSSSTYSSSLSSYLPSSSSLSSASSSSSLLSSPISSSSSSSSYTFTSCPVVINNSDFYYKGGNVSVSNFSPLAINNVAIKIILPAGAIVSSSSGTSYNQTGNILRFYIPTINAYTNIDTSYIHNYLGYYPVTTIIECNQSQPVSATEFFKSIDQVK